MKKLLTVLLCIALMAQMVGLALSEEWTDDGLEVEVVDGGEAIEATEEVPEELTLLSEISGEETPDEAEDLSTQDVFATEEEEETASAPEPAFASNSSDFEIENGVLKKYKGPGGDVVVPDGVTEIGYSSFGFCYGLASVRIPEGVTTIWHNAFEGCSNLNNVVLPDSLITIGVSAFRGCSSLRTIRLPANLERIFEHAFQSSGLQSIVFPDSIIQISYRSFNSAHSLTDITIPGNIKHVGEECFAHCQGLTSVTLEEGVQEIEGYAFGESGIKNVTISGSVSCIGAMAFYSCRNLTSVTLEEGIETIELDAFTNCENLKKIAIPVSVNSIGDHALGYTCTYEWDEELDEDVRAFKPIKDFTIYGTSGTAAEKYAAENGFTFIDETGTVKHTHTPVTDKAVAATCTAAGKTEGSHCSTCGAVLVAQKAVAAKGHTPAKDAAVAATCTTAGKTEGSHCSTCGAVLVAQKAVAARGHSAVTDAAVNPTCTASGLTEGSHCAVCGTVLVAQQAIPATGHTPVYDAGFAPTYKTTGLTDGSHCAVCGAIIVPQQVIPMLDASFHMTKSTSKSVNVGDPIQIVVDGQVIKSCKTSNKKVATVSSKGLVTAKAAGTAKITITLKNKKKLTLTVKVSDPYAPKSIKIVQGKSVTMKKGEKLALGTTLTPDGAKSKLTWKSSSKSVATVSSSGVVTAKKAGKATITVTTANGKKAAIKITVKK